MEARRRLGPEIWEADRYAVAPSRAGDPLVFDMRVPDRIVRQLEFERADGQITRLHPSPAGAVSGQALQAIRRLTSTSAALLDSLRNLEPSSPLRGGHRRLTKAEQDAVEQRAMTVTSDYYTERGWAVKDVSAYRPYDLVCSQGTREQHVEVKGSAGALIVVELTRNEVTHARSCSCETALAAVESIQLKPGARRPRRVVVSACFLRGPSKIRPSGL